MNLLLDANVLIWLGTGPRSISANAVKAIQSANNLFYSPVSIAEIGIKVGKGKLNIQPDLRSYIAGLVTIYDLQCLPLDDESAYELEKLPTHHKDPFDRLLVCQAIAHRLALLSADSTLRKYPIQVIW